MQWWNEFVDWVGSDDGWRILSSAVFPLLAIVVAGFIAAMIGRGSARRLLSHHDREQRVSTVASLIGAARRASKWNTLSALEQEHADHLAHDADVSIRLLPLAGASMTADWASHEIAEMKKNSVSFSFQAEQSLVEFRDRLVDWQSKPSRARKLFKADLDLWAYESAQEDRGLVEKQQEWAKQRVAAETGPVTTVASGGSWGVQDPGTPSTAQAVPAAPPAVPPAAAVTAGADAPASVTPPAAAGAPAPAASTGESPQLETPSPISAQTVRQRILPNYDDHDPR